MRNLVLASAVVCVAGAALVDAQQPQREETRDLPIRRVVLYKSGIGFFEHVGRVTGDQRVAIPFTSPQLDDVLKTLTVLDLDGGSVSSVGYASEAPLSRRLGALGLPVGEKTTLPQLLSALRGARVDVRRAGISVSGRLLDVESRNRQKDGAVESVDQVAIVTESGDVHAIDLGAGTVLRFADPALNQRVNRYLEIVSTARDQSRRVLAIDAAGSGARRLYVSYVSEVPVWKTTYRVVLPANGDKAMLQGWAIVDNTVGDDWTNVELSLVSGAPQSFVQPLSQPLYTRRPEVPMPSGFLLRPQTHDATLVPGSAGGVAVDGNGAALPGVTVRLFDSRGRLVGSTVTDASGRFAVPGLAGRLRAELSLPGFSATSVEFESGNDQRVVMSVTGAAETVSVTAAAGSAGGSGGGAYRPGTGVRGGVVGGRVGGSPAPPPPPSALSPATIRSSIELQIAARDLGELFEYKLRQPVTIRQNQSAMVPIVAAAIDAERVSVWNRADSTTRPRRALWITNTSGLTLDGGSVTILDRETFAGEGLVETIKPNERRLLSYAADLGVQVQDSPLGEQGPRQRISIARGTVTVETSECEQLRYTARNQDTTPRQLVIEHPRREGWTLVDGGPAPMESSTALHRFQVAMAPQSTASLTVATERRLKTEMAVYSMTDEQLYAFMQQGAVDDKGRDALMKLSAARAAVAEVEMQIFTRQQETERISQDQVRVRENMESLKASREERTLLVRYVTQLNAQEDRLTALREDTASLTRQRDERSRALVRLIDAMIVDAAGGAMNCTAG